MAIPTWLVNLGVGFANAVGLGDKLNALVINGIVNSTRNRPHPWSTVSDYISWQGLTDRTFQGRHLPATPPPPNAPDWTLVAQLFTRPNGMANLSKKSTCLFPAFAQYLTDGFIRTNVSHDVKPPATDPLMRRMTTTNHEIDMCPLYGRTVGQTRALRLSSEAPGQKGRLKTQTINGEDFAPFLYLPNLSGVKPEFAELDLPLGLNINTDKPNTTSAQFSSVFAFGGDRANATPFVAMMNTLFLREHNRLAHELETRNPAWNDERVFQTARNIVIPMFIKIVVEEYINHINPVSFRLRADPSVAWDAKWNRPNWITAEFSLLYRWHSLIPDGIDWPTGRIDMSAFPRDNGPLVQVGLAAAFVAAASQPAGELGALNTNQNLLPFEEKAVNQARINQLASYNAYRVQFGQKAAQRFEDISSDPTIQKLLKDIYVTPDRVELYPGLFAEDRVKNSPLPGLLLTMVAVDAFSQALTNPLLSEHVWNPPKPPQLPNQVQQPYDDAFTAWGRTQIAATSTLEDILRRNVPAPPAVTPLRMTQASWKPS
jgi:prostaglandin-endoperoxide synthase 2